MKSKYEQDVDFFVMEFFEEFPDAKYTIIPQSETSPQGVCFNLDVLTEEQVLKLTEGLKQLKEKHEKV